MVEISVRPRRVQNACAHKRAARVQDVRVQRFWKKPESRAHVAIICKRDFDNDDMLQPP